MNLAEQGYDLNKIPYVVQYNKRDLANAVSLEELHKVMNGQPAEAMPALRALDPQIATDIVVHLQTLPK